MKWLILGHAPHNRFRSIIKSGACPRPEFPTGIEKALPLCHAKWEAKKLLAASRCFTLLRIASHCQELNPALPKLETSSVVPSIKAGQKGSEGSWVKHNRLKRCFHGFFHAHCTHCAVQLCKKSLFAVKMQVEAMHRAEKPVVEEWVLPVPIGGS